MVIHRFTRILIASFAGWLLAAPLPADTIFTWTDAQGIKHFSNLPPPKSVDRFGRIETRVTTLPCEGPEPQRRAYDEMIEQYRNEAAQSEAERGRIIENQSTQEQLNRRGQLNEKIRYERQRLKYQIEQLRRRAVSPTYSQGMRAGHIQALEDRLQRLEDDPQAYFRTAD